MDPNKKPFTCCWKDCKKEFTNEDHLTVHMKKHNLALYLGNDCQTLSVADQTPTPTSFIRNCEELGLFQDLQNVNPFDETFRKATDLTKSDLSVEETKKSDETLHTPHILPQVKEESIIIKVENSELEDPANLLANKENSKDRHHVPDEIKSSSRNSSQLLFSNRNVSPPIDHDVDTTATLSLRKDYSIFGLRYPQKTTGVNQSVQYCSDSSDSLEDTLRIVTVDNQLNIDEKLQRQREMNRAAQTRSRKKKKQMFERLLEEVNKLKKDKKSLAVENRQLLGQIQRLKMVLSYHHDCSTAKDPVTQQKLTRLLQPPKEDTKQNGTLITYKPIKPICPNNQQYSPVPPNPCDLQTTAVPTQTVTPIVSSRVAATNMTDPEDTSAIIQINGHTIDPSRIVVIGPPLVVQVPRASLSATPPTININVAKTVEEACIHPHAQQTTPKLIPVEKQTINKISRKVNSKRKKYK